MLQVIQNAARCITDALLGTHVSQQGIDPEPLCTSMPRKGTAGVKSQHGSCKHVAALQNLTGLDTSALARLLIFTHAGYLPKQWTEADLMLGLQLLKHKSL